MKLLITGASGFLGRHLLRVLARHGHRGVATGRTPPSDPPPGWTSLSRADVLRTPDNQHEIEAVVQLEVKQHVPRPTARDIADFAVVNIRGTEQWLAWASQAGVDRFVYASTVKSVKWHGSIIDESAPAELSDPYGASKAAAEHAVQTWTLERANRRAVALRFAPIYGPGNAANLAAFARQIISGKPCLVGRGDTRKSVVSRCNAAAAIVHLLGVMQDGYEVLNVADPVAPSMAELAEMIARACNAPTPRSIPYPVAFIAAMVGDVMGASLGMKFAITTSRLKTLRKDSIFSIDKLLEAGFVHPQTTDAGIMEMGRWLASEFKNL